MRMYLPNRQERTRTWFALFPVCIKSEIRWLETVTVEERLVRGMYYAGWFKVAFIDDTPRRPIE